MARRASKRRKRKHDQAAKREASGVRPGPAIRSVDVVLQRDGGAGLATIMGAEQADGSLMGANGIRWQL